MVGSVVAGVVPGKGGETIFGVPVFNTVKQDFRDAGREKEKQAVVMRDGRRLVLERCFINAATGFFLDFAPSSYFWRLAFVGKTA